MPVTFSFHPSMNTACVMSAIYYITGNPSNVACAPPRRAHCNTTVEICCRVQLFCVSHVGINARLYSMVQICNCSWEKLSFFNFLSLLVLGQLVLTIREKYPENRWVSEMYANTIWLSSPFFTEHCLFTYYPTANLIPCHHANTLLPTISFPNKH